MVTLEKALFDMNEALHHMNIIPMEKSITLSSIVFAMVVTILLMPLYVKFTDYLFSADRDLKHTVSFVLLVMLGLLYLLGGFLLVLIALALIGCIVIIYKYERYRGIREFIDRIL